MRGLSTAEGMFEYRKSVLASIDENGDLKYCISEKRADGRKKRCRSRDDGVSREKLLFFTKSGNGDFEIFVLKTCKKIVIKS